MRAGTVYFRFFIDGYFRFFSDLSQGHIYFKYDYKYKERTEKPEISMPHASCDNRTLPNRIRDTNVPQSH